MLIPNSEQLQAISKMREGDLGEIPFSVLLHTMAVHQRSVVLEIERKPLKKEIMIELGVPVDCRSNLLHETLSRFMVSQGTITDEECQIYMNKAAQQGLQFGEAVILDGKITASELFRLLQANLARKLLDGFTWRSGSFRVLAKVPKVESPLKVKVPQLVVTGIGKFAGEAEVNGAVGPLVGKRLFLHPDPPYTLDEIRLTRSQTELIALLENGKRIDEMAAETTIPFNKIMRLLYSLAVIGIVVPEDQMPAEPAEPAPPRPAKRAQVSTDTVVLKLKPQAGPKIDAADVETLRDRVMTAYLRYRKQDALELLDLAEDASLLDLQDAYIAYSRKFAPWQYEATEVSSLAEKAEDLFLAGGRAFGELCDPEKRNALILRRGRQRDERAKRPAEDRFAIKSNLLDSELQFKKGKSLMAQAKYREALALLQFAYDCDPQNADYRAELAYCKFLDRPDLEADAALEELHEALRLDAKCGLAIYYAGMVHMQVENYDESEKYLKRAIKMLMPDRRPIEGLKQLQTTRSKKKRKLGFL